MTKTSIRTLVFMALFISLVIVSTMAVRIPTVITGGYINIGDITVILAGLLLGGKKGFIIGAIGSALADLLGGYAIFVPITFIAKGGEGFVAGYIGKDVNSERKTLYIIFSSCLAGLWMVFIYFTGEWLFMGFPKALSSVVPNIMQAVTGIIFAIVLYKVLSYRLKKVINEEV